MLYPRGLIADLPDGPEFAARKQRFAELDGLQPGWQVELRQVAGQPHAVHQPQHGGRGEGDPAHLRLKLQLWLRQT